MHVYIRVLERILRGTLTNAPSVQTTMLACIPHLKETWTHCSALSERSQPMEVYGEEVFAVTAFVLTVPATRVPFECRQ